MIYSGFKGKCGEAPWCQVQLLGANVRCSLLGRDSKIIKIISAIGLTYNAVIIMIGVLSLYSV